MFDEIMRIAKFLRIATEFAVFFGVVLLLYFWASVVDFFPPSLSLGDTAKLALVAFVGAGFAFTIGFANTSISGFLIVAVLNVGRWLRLIKADSKLERGVAKFNLFMQRTDFFYVLAFGAVFLIFLIGFRIIPNFSTLFALFLVGSTSFLLLLMSSTVLLNEGSDRDEITADFEVPVARKIFIFGVVVALGGPLFASGGAPTYVSTIMSTAGVLSDPERLYVEQKYCGLVEASLEVGRVSDIDGFCTFENVLILFQGMGSRVLLGTDEGQGTLPLPADSVFENKVDTKDSG